MVLAGSFIIECTLDKILNYYIDRYLKTVNYEDKKWKYALYGLGAFIFGVICVQIADKEKLSYDMLVESN